MTLDVKLTAEELLVLDGKCRAETQTLVEQARTQIAVAQSGLPDCEAAMVAKIRTVAEKKGKLTWVSVHARRCPCCGTDGGYYRVARRTKYKRKGELDYDRPILIRVFDLDRSGVVMQNTVFTGYCDKCADRVRPVLADLLRNVRAAIPQGITSYPPRFQHWDNRECTVCKWQGHEGELGLLRTFMGDGNYRGQCPKCGAKNELFSHKIDSREGFTLVEIKTEVAA